MARPALARATQNKLVLLDADATDGSDSSGEEEDEDEEYVAKPRRGGPRGKAKTAHRAKTRAKTAPPPVDIRPRSRYTMAQHDDIMQEISNKILFQPLAVDHICSLLLTVHIGGGRMFYKGVHARMHKRILSGPSGVGKTEMVRTLRHWLCMDEGDYYEHQFVDIDASECKDQTTVNKIIGSGSGYADSDSRHTLVHRLIAASKSPHLRRAEQLDKKSTAYRAAMREYEREGDPPFILLFIDEIDKAHPDLMNAMNGLLGEGTMQASTGGHRFVLPEKTELIILFTSNYGAEAIARMRMEDDLQAVAHVEKAMVAHGLGKHSIERFGAHIIFYRISDADMRVVIQRKIEQCLDNPQHQLTQKYGAIDYTDALQCITDFVVLITDPGRGVRNSLKHLDNCLQPLIAETFRKLEAMPRDRRDSLMQANDRSLALSLFKETLQLELLDDPCQLAVWSAQRPSHLPSGDAIVRAMQSTARNQLQLKLYRDSAEHEIHALGIARGGAVINCAVVPYVVVKNQYNITQYGSDDHKQLKGDYRNLHNRYTELRDAVTNDNQPRIAELIQEEPPRKLDLSDEDEDENVIVGPLPPALQVVVQQEGPVKKKRKLCIEQTHVVAPVHEPDVLTDRVEEMEDDDDEVDGLDPRDARRGRRLKQYDGFTYMRRHSNHTYHRCNACEQCVDARYIRQHLCREQ